MKREIVLKRHRRNRRMPLRAALGYTAERGWPVLPGVGEVAGAGCRCGLVDCAAPGTHPGGPRVPGLPELLAATTDERMVRWWWTTRPRAPVLLATGGSAPCALSFPAYTGDRALTALGLLGVSVGPVLALPQRVALLVAPYETAQLGAALCGLLDLPGHGVGGSGAGTVSGPPAPAARLPDGLSFHGAGGYLPLPPSQVGGGRVAWLRLPSPIAGHVAGRWRGGADRRGAVGTRCAELPDATVLLAALIEAERRGLLTGRTETARQPGAPRPGGAAGGRAAPE